MFEQKLSKKLLRSISIVVEDHEIVQIDVGGRVRTQFNSHITTIVSWDPKSGAVLNRSNLYRNPGNRKDTPANKIC